MSSGGSLGASVTTHDFVGLQNRAQAIARRALQDRTITPGEAEAILALFEIKQKLHRRAQKAESDLAKVPTFQVLTEALEENKQLRVERHKLRIDNAFMKAERSRLKKRIRELEGK